LLGLYKNKKLFKTYKSIEKTSDILPKLFKEIEDIYDINALYYAKGPGSFMAIKVSYVFLKSYSIAKNIDFLAVDGFYFNHNSPIKALGKTYFIKEGNNITFDTITPKKDGDFSLPNILDDKCFSHDTLPLYVLPAI